MLTEDEKELILQMSHRFDNQIEARIKALENDPRMSNDKKEASRERFEKQKCILELLLFKIKENLI